KEDPYSLRSIHPNAVRGAITSLAIDFGISIIPSRDEEDTANLLYIIAKREQEEENREIPLRGERKPLLVEEKQRYVVESLPNVSAVLAKRLLDRFGSVYDVMNASKKELMGVEGIGEGKADEIRRVIKGRYIKDIKV
ncbi:MAG: helix-hairpin-helix domain-containing protein, partial [Candidatus Altiarchaeota archaeon]|nr:helix-hairpin-helix domain-containing protein [Candidatus Altiarchaeota archaeon]